MRPLSVASELDIQKTLPAVLGRLRGMRRAKRAVKLVEPSGAMPLCHLSILGVTHSVVKPIQAHRSRGQGNGIAVTALFPIHKMQPFWV